MLFLAIYYATPISIRSDNCVRINNRSEGFDSNPTF